MCEIYDQITYLMLVTDPRKNESNQVGVGVTEKLRFGSIGYHWTVVAEILLLRFLIERLEDEWNLRKSSL